MEQLLMEDSKPSFRKLMTRVGLKVFLPCLLFWSSDFHSKPQKQRAEHLWKQTTSVNGFPKYYTSRRTKHTHLLKLKSRQWKPINKSIKNTHYSQCKSTAANFVNYRQHHFFFFLVNVIFLNRHTSLNLWILEADIIIQIIYFFILYIFFLQFKQYTMPENILNCYYWSTEILATENIFNQN